MNRFLYLLWLLISSLSAQNKIIIVRSSQSVTSAKLEEKLITSAIQLYNQKNKDKFYFEFKNKDEFSAIFNEVDNYPNKDLILGISQISYTEERNKKYELSSIYLPIKTALVKSKQNANEFGKNGNDLVAVLAGTIQETMLKSLKNKYKFTMKSYENFQDMINDCVQLKIQFILVENIDVYDHPDLTTVEEFDDQNNGYVIIYQKNSTLREKLEPFLSYFIKSALYKNEIKKIFGKDFFKYVVN